MTSKTRPHVRSTKGISMMVMLLLATPLLTTQSVFGADVLPAVPQDLHQAVDRNLEWIAYNVAPEGSACCHGTIGTERAFLVNASKGWESAREVVGATTLTGFTQFQYWMPGRESMSIIAGTVAGGRPSSLGSHVPPTCANNIPSSCVLPGFSGYIVDFDGPNRPWSPESLPDAWETGYLRPWYDTITGRHLGYFAHALLSDGGTAKLYRLGRDGRNPNEIILNAGPVAVHGCNVAARTLWLTCDGGRGGAYPASADYIDCPSLPAPGTRKCSSVEFYQPVDSSGSSFSWVTNASARLGAGYWNQGGNEALFIGPGEAGAQGQILVWRNATRTIGTFHARYAEDCQYDDDCPYFGWDSEIPAFSPDGRYIYLSLPDPARTKSRMIGRVNISKPEKDWRFEPLTAKWTARGLFASARFPTVSPDGKAIAFVANSGKPHEGRIQLFVMPANGSRRPRQVTHVPEKQLVRLPTWR